MSQITDVLLTLTIPEALALIGEDQIFEHQGHTVRMSSLRLRTFKEKGTDCVMCACVGTHFAIERHVSRKTGRPTTHTYHANLYGKMPDGRIRLMTHDHIIPRSNWGAPGLIENSVTMCEHCNGKKGNKIPSADFVERFGGAIVPYYNIMEEANAKGQQEPSGTDSHLC